MKRTLRGLLCVLLCLGLFGCRQEEDAPIQVPAEFFYPRSTFSYTADETVIGSEHREAAGHEDDIAYLIDLYLRGPQSETLTQPFPIGCRVVSCTLKSDTTLTLVVNDNFAALTGMELSVACVCLAKTLSGLTGADTVIIQTQTQLLDGKKSITIRDGAPVLLDEYIAPSQPE